MGMNGGEKTVLKILKETNRLHETIFLSLSALFCLGISVFRCIYTGARMFLFLNWNLFLAFVPWALTTLAIIKPWIQKSKIRIGLLVIIWLLFFPNAPYILTDLFYLRRRFTMPIWYDLLLILSFAWTGLLFGFLSLWDIERILNKFMKPVFITILSTLFLFIGSFGIYIGRYLRWNSWDILTDPLELIYDISDRVVNPFAHRTTWGMTLFMGLFLNMLYWSFRLIRKRNEGA
ncbi:membrane protein [Spirochaetia bacterium]|nr:membrane protein [Spirochaetia bacterium]